MRKRMTLKEFKEVFNSTSMDFDVYGWEGILNLISIAQDCMSEMDFRNGAPKIGAIKKKDADIIYDALERRGFYDFNGEVN